MGAGDWKMDLWARIWPLRLEAGEGGGTLKEKEKEKIPLCESIGHRLLRGCCPKRPDTWLPQLRAGGQGIYLSSPEHLGRSSTVKEKKT